MAPSRVLFAVLIGFAASLPAAILPEKLDAYTRGAVAPVTLQYPQLAKEFGLAEAESASYKAGAKEFRLSVYRLQDATGAVALEQLLRGSQTAVFHYQNFVFAAEGQAPRGAIDAYLLPGLQNVNRAAGPSLLRLLPPANRIPASERYILGPDSLKLYEPRVNSAAAGFDFGGEAQLAQFKTPDGPIQLLIFRYPNNAIAKERFQALLPTPGAILRRQGPLVHIALPVDANVPIKSEYADKIFNAIRFEVTITLDKAPPMAIQTDAGGMLVSIFILIGLLLGFCLFAGLAFAGGRIAYRRFTGDSEDGSMTTLGI